MLQAGDTVETLIEFSENSLCFWCTKYWERSSKRSQSEVCKTGHISDLAF
jgi:hypothetical protein